jgi:dienelactone hydrolase
MVGRRCRQAEGTFPPVTAQRLRLRHVLAAAAAVVALVLLAVAGNSIARYRGWIVQRLDPAALSAKLAPYYRVMKPDGSGPFPTALIYSGCDGPRDNAERWGAMLDARGWAAIIVDSHTPRGLTRYEVWRLVCAGQLFMGSERAGDVLVSIADARRMPFVDPRNMVLIGASHGGWAIMDLLALDPPRRLPFNLAALPPGPADPLEGVVGMILLYPYCGDANLARHGWRRPIPTLFLLSAEDYVAPAERCREIADRLAAAGRPVEVVSFEGVTHAFDQEQHSPVSPLAFDPQATARALEAGARFLDEVRTAR